MPLSAAERSRNARKAALTRSAQSDGAAMTEPKRRAFLDSFLPDDPGLSEEERQRRGRAALRAHMISLSQKAAAARRNAARALRDAEDLAEELGDLADEAV